MPRQLIAPLLLTVLASPLPAEEPEWVASMQKVHAQFEGTPGYVAQFGDSITYSNAFWTPLDWDEPQQYLPEEADGFPPKPADKRWRDWIQGERAKGPKHGNYSGWTVKNLLKAVPEVLQRQRPVAAIVMIGTNDISSGKLPESYPADLDTVVQLCLEAHCIPILNTIPPRVGKAEAVEACNQAIRTIAEKRKVPLVDYHHAIVTRRPDGSWKGTLISPDGVHPSGGKTNIYAAENLSTSGYALRNWVNFLKLREIYFRVIEL